jgi:hypothetical protein
MLWIQNVGRLFSTSNWSQPTLWITYWLKFSCFPYWVVGSPVVKDVVEDLEEYLENVDDLKSSTTSSLKRCRWFQIIDMLNNRQILPNRNCSTLAIPWCFYKISRAFDGFSTSIIWQKDHPPQLKHRPIFPLVTVTNVTFCHIWSHFITFCHISGKDVTPVAGSIFSTLCPKL